MYCTNCGAGPTTDMRCGSCGFAIPQQVRPSPKPQTNPKTGPSIPPPPIPPAPPVPPAQSTSEIARPSVHPGNPEKPRVDAAERLAQTGKVVGITGCSLALVFWIIIPLVVLLIALAATSSTGFAFVAVTVIGVSAIVWWAWKRSGG